MFDTFNILRIFVYQCRVAPRDSFGSGGPERVGSGAVGRGRRPVSHVSHKGGPLSHIQEICIYGFLVVDRNVNIITLTL